MSKKQFELETRTLGNKSKTQAMRILQKNDIRPYTYRFVHHKALKQHSVFAGSNRVGVVQEGNGETKAVLILIDPFAPEAISCEGKPPVTDWSKYDQSQIWEIWQGLVDDVDVSGFCNPHLPASEMTTMRLAA